MTVEQIMENIRSLQVERDQSWFYREEDIDPIIKALAEDRERLRGVIKYILQYDQNSPERSRMREVLAASEAVDKEMGK